jgi:DNA-binding NarL/FixJ family response regulator
VRRKSGAADRQRGGIVMLHKDYVVRATVEQLHRDAHHYGAKRDALAPVDHQRLEGPADETLTPQEFQVSRLIALGMSNREAATALFLSRKTIEFHLSNVYRKLGIRSRTQLARQFALSQRWSAEPQVGIQSRGST